MLHACKLPDYLEIDMVTREQIKINVNDIRGIDYPLIGGFMSFSTLFQSYQVNGKIIIIGLCIMKCCLCMERILHIAARAQTGDPVILSWEP